jgi:hypothetical protein
MQFIYHNGQCKLLFVKKVEIDAEPENQKGYYQVLIIALWKDA